MKRHVLLLAFASAAVLLQTGCVTGQRTVPLSITVTSVAPAPTKGDLRLDAVTDNRVFQNKPSDPSIPSVDGDVLTLSDTQRGMMIGRQRNAYGMAMGDIALPADDSVAKRTRLLIEQGLQQRGYRITNDPGAANSASVSVDEFWAWFSPGMWSVSFEARVNCTLTLRKAGQPATVVVKGYGINRGQVASDANWQLAYDRAFIDFLEKFGPELAKAGF